MSERVTHVLRPIGSTFYKDKRKYHIVGVMRDIEKDMIVYVARYYGKHRQWWHYEAITAQEFDLDVEFNLIKEQ